MKNINKWKQIDFSKGEDETTPANQIPSNAVSRMLNFLPNKEGKPATLRPGFQEWIVHNEYGSSDILGIEKVTAYSIPSGNTPDKSTISQAKMISYLADSTTGKKVSVKVVFDNVANLANSQYVTDEAVWVLDSAGVTEPGGGGENPPPVPLETINLSPFNLNPTYFPTALLDTDPFVDLYVDDIWSDEDAIESGYIGGYDGKNNNSFWGGDGYFSTAWGELSPDPDLKIPNYWQYFWGYEDGVSLIGDYWYPMQNKPFVTPSGPAPSLMELGRPYYQKLVDIGNPIFRNPTMNEPHIDFTIDIKEANRKVTFNFAYDATNFGIEAYIYCRNSVAAIKTWLPVNVKSSELVPIFIGNQANVETPDDRWDISFSVVEQKDMVSCSFYCSFIKPEFRIILAPSSILKTKEDLGGYFAGVKVE